MLIGNRPGVCCDTSRERCIIILLRSRETATLALFVFKMPPIYGDGPDRRSRTGYIILMCGAAIVWGSRLQTTVALSTVEAEYMSLAAACQALLHVRQLLKSPGIKFSGPFKMFEDNQGCIALANNALTTTNRTKHIDVKYHFIRQCVQRNQVKVIWIPTLES